MFVVILITFCGTRVFLRQIVICHNWKLNKQMLINNYFIAGIFHFIHNHLRARNALLLCGLNFIAMIIQKSFNFLDLEYLVQE